MQGDRVLFFTSEWPADVCSGMHAHAQAAFPGPGATGSSRSGGRRAADSGQSRESVHTQTEKHTQPGLAPAPFGRGITKEEVKADVRASFVPQRQRWFRDFFC